MRPTDKSPCYLLGIDWGHDVFDHPVLDAKGKETGSFVRGNSGFMKVVPAWKIAELLNREDLVQMRKRQEIEDEEKFREMAERSSTVSDVAEGDTFTRDDYISDLVKATRPDAPWE